MNLAEKYPKLFDRLTQKDIELRHLLSIDENYEDIDSEEYEFDFEDYNYIIYVTELLQDALGTAKMEEFMVRLHDRDEFVNFLASQEDLYAVQSSLSTQEVADLTLGLIEEII